MSPNCEIVSSVCENDTLSTLPTRFRGRNALLPAWVSRLKSGHGRAAAPADETEYIQSSWLVSGKIRRLARAPATIGPLYTSASVAYGNFNGAKIAVQCRVVNRRLVSDCQRAEDPLTPVKRLNLGGTLTNNITYDLLRPPAQMYMNGKPAHFLVSNLLELEQFPYV